MSAQNQDQPVSERATLKRNARRAEYSKDSIHRCLVAQQMCTVAYVSDGEPRQIPTLYIVHDEYMYLHGNRQAAFLKHMAAGGEVCINVLLVDGVVVARSGFNCSMNYRSVTIYGRGEAVEGEDHRWALDQFVSVLVPGHEKVVREPTPQELAATAVARVRLDEMVAKVRDGGPLDDAGDLDADVWAGVIPVAMQRAAAQPADDLKETVGMPDYINEFSYRG